MTFRDKDLHQMEVGGALCSAPALPFFCHIGSRNGALQRVSAHFGRQRVVLPAAIRPNQWWRPCRQGQAGYT
jgi:hypothetical protein